MGRTPCCDKNGLKKGPWTPEEDQKLINYIQKHGHGSWRTLPKNAGLARCGKSCRLRWTNYLRPDIKRGRFSFEEEETIIQLHSILGNKWSAIAARLPGRTDNEIKNYWNTHIRKRLLRMGIDPVTHSPRLDLLDLSTLLSNPNLFNASQFIDISRLLGVETPMNSDLLRFATNSLSSQGEDAINSSQIQDPFQSFQTHQIQEVPPCTTSSAHFFSDSNLMQPNEQAYNLWQANGMPCNFSENLVHATSGVGYDNLEQSVPQFLSDNSNFHLSSNQNYTTVTSVLSTPAGSSPTTQLNSSSTYINSSTEDERDSYCSELFKFQIPDLLDVSEFM
ncbi:uncharacterized protein A4U43_C03F8630 [Asparagus officinalis]|uniref:Uncharacterized protein n=1 Tax=Asparagus officinalis TaxID=4686 RepID=A0A5P1FDG0_ASPOF|nr:myb-related protein Zm38-like [Asparagus officinalis]ONK74641.1 uncharacterized protein A4U43_C03F8630 [Asparagus officinalis]